MQIVLTKNFSKSLDHILDYIAKDSLNRSIQFNRQLQKSIDNLSHMPFKNRKSYYYDDDNVRDMIFKGYTVPYLVDERNNRIVLLDIFKWIDK